MPGPGTMCALMMSAHLTIWYKPPVYCSVTVLPMSANFRSSKMRNPAGGAYGSAWQFTVGPPLIVCRSDNSRAWPALHIQGFSCTGA